MYDPFASNFCCPAFLESVGRSWWKEECLQSCFKGLDTESAETWLILHLNLSRAWGIKAYGFRELLSFLEGSDFSSPRESLMLFEASLHASEADCHFTLHRVGDELSSQNLMSSELYGQRTMGE